MIKRGEWRVTTVGAQAVTMHFGNAMFRLPESYVIVIACRCFEQGKGTDCFGKADHLGVHLLPAGNTL